MGLFAVFQLMYQSARLVRIILRRPAIRGLSLILLPFLVSGMVFFHVVEEMAWIDALYFSVVTLTSVGYGDLVPETTIGKIFTMLYIILGIGLFILFITELATVIAEEHPLGRKVEKSEQRR